MKNLKSDQVETTNIKHLLVFFQCILKPKATKYNLCFHLSVPTYVVINSLGILFITDKYYNLKMP